MRISHEESQKCRATNSAGKIEIHLKNEERFIKGRKREEKARNVERFIFNFQRSMSGQYLMARILHQRITKHDMRAIYTSSFSVEPN